MVCDLWSDFERLLVTTGAHIELQDVSITAALADETPNTFYTDSLQHLQLEVAIHGASGTTCDASFHLPSRERPGVCGVEGNIRPSQGLPAPFGLQGITFQTGDALTLNDPNGIDIDDTWTVDVMIQTPLPQWKLDASRPQTVQGWHTLVRGQAEDHPIIVSATDEDTLGAFDNSAVRGAGSIHFFSTPFKMSSLADGWHRLTVTGAEGMTTYYVDGEQVAELTFTPTADIHSVGNFKSTATPPTAQSLQQAWGDLAGFMLFDDAMTAGQVSALYAGACIGTPGANGGPELQCQTAEQTSGLQIGDQVEHAWRTEVTPLCHAAVENGGGLGSTTITAPDPMISRGTVCGFDGSLVLVRWDMSMNTAPTQDHPNCVGCAGRDDQSCSHGHPYWTRLANGDANGAPRSPEWLASWVGDPGRAGNTGFGMADTCGVKPTQCELKGAIPPFELVKLTCTSYPLECTELGAEVINTGGKHHGGHRRTQTAIHGGSMGIRGTRGKPGHQGIDSGSTDTCTMTSIQGMAENVDADCCYQNGVYKCASHTHVPEACSYACGAVLVPFVDECHDLLTATFVTQLTALTELYDACINADPRILADAYAAKDCCTAGNCGGCKSDATCGALTGQCQWTSATIGRQIDTRCNCVLDGMDVYTSVLAEHTDAYPDYAACSAACAATLGCNFFGVWEATPGDDVYPDYCRLWTGCNECIQSTHYNTVWQLNPEYEKTPPMSYADAESYCIGHGGHLASVHSQEQHESIWAVARGDRVWIGLNDRVWDTRRGQSGVEGTWVWTDGSPTDYYNWHRTGAATFTRACRPEEAALPQNAAGLPWPAGCGQPDNASEQAGGEHEDVSTQAICRACVGVGIAFSSALTVPLLLIAGSVARCTLVSRASGTMRCAA